MEISELNVFTSIQVDIASKKRIVLSNENNATRLSIPKGDLINVVKSNLRSIKK